MEPYQLRLNVSKICVIGLGYVGLTLATAFAESGHQVIGLEKAEVHLTKIKSGLSPFFDEGLDKSLTNVIANKTLQVFGTTAEINQKFEFIVITIGSQINSDLETDLANFLKLVPELLTISEHNCTVILRSTVPVGTSRKLQEYLEEFKPVINVAFCPERTIEGKAFQELFTLPQIVSGSNEFAKLAAQKLFNTLTKETILVTSTESAELVKLTSNMWRDFTFAFSNELFIQSLQLNLDITEVIEAANKNYPRNAIPMPGAVGGPCLTKDTHIYSQSINSHKHIFSQARSVNKTFPRIFLEKHQSKISEIKSIAILGWAFKGSPQTTDLRSSPSFVYHSNLLTMNENLNVFAWDAEKIDPTQLSGGVIWKKDLNEVISNCDAILIANNHPYFSSSEFQSLLSMVKERLFILDPWTNLKKGVDLSHEILHLGSVLP